MVLVTRTTAFSGRVRSSDWTEGGHLAARSDLCSLFVSLGFLFLRFFFFLNLDAGYVGECFVLF